MPVWDRLHDTSTYTGVYARRFDSGPAINAAASTRPPPYANSLMTVCVACVYVCLYVCAGVCVCVCECVCVFPLPPVQWTRVPCGHPPAREAGGVPRRTISPRQIPGAIEISVIPVPFPRRGTLPIAIAWANVCGLNPHP